MRLSDIKAGVVGVGFIGVAHIEALRRLGIDVAGVVGSSPERARAKADAANLPKVYDSLADLAADPEIDVIHIASPNHAHADQVRLALDAGKHVVCEKPLALNSADTADLVARADTAGLINAVCFNIRFYPNCHQAMSLVASGDIGTPRLVTAAISRTGCCSRPIGTGGSSPTRPAGCGPLPTSDRTGSTWPGSSPGPTWSRSWPTSTRWCRCAPTRPDRSRRLRRRRRCRSDRRADVLGRCRRSPAALRQRRPRRAHHLPGVGRPQELGDRSRSTGASRRCRGSPRTPTSCGSAIGAAPTRSASATRRWPARRRPE